MALNEFGGATLLVNNTGINPTLGPLVAMNPAMGRKIVEVNAVRSFLAIGAITIGFTNARTGARAR